MDSKIKEWKKFMERNPEIFLKHMKDVGANVHSQSGTELRSKLPQELWDKVSEGFGQRSDWKNMNDVLKSKTGLHYPYNKETPSYKRPVESLRKVQDKFKRNRVPYHHLIRAPGTSETDEYHAEVVTAMSKMLFKGNIAAAEQMTKVLEGMDHNHEIGNLVSVSDYMRHIGDAFVNLISEEESIDWGNVKKGFYFLAKNMKHYRDRDTSGVSDYEDMVWHIRDGVSMPWQKELKTLKILVKEGSKIFTRSEMEHIYDDVEQFVAESGS